MIRYTAYTILALLIALCAYWITSNPGLVLITWQGWEVRFSLAVMVFLAILYTVMIWGLLRLLKWLNIFALFNDPKRLAAKRVKAERNLDLAWSAYSLGDDREAIKHGLRAKSLLGDEHSILRLLASATQRMGEAKNPYLDKLENSSESSTWVKKQHLDTLISEKSWQKAKPLVTEMIAVHPKNHTLLRLDFMLSARLGNWQEADNALLTASKEKGVFTSQQLKHYRAVIDYCLALEEKAAGRKSENQRLIKSSLKNDPAFVPAALAYAKTLIEQNDQKTAEKVISAAWKNAPNQELAETLEELYPLESSNEAYRRLKKVADSATVFPESGHMLARAAIKAEQWPEARQALQSLINKSAATKTTYQLLARLEKKQKNDEAASQKLLERAERAKDDNHWRCHSCDNYADHYNPLCPHCGEFDQIRWASM